MELDQKATRGGGSRGQNEASNERELEEEEEDEDEEARVQEGYWMLEEEPDEGICLLRMLLHNIDGSFHS